MQDLINVLEVQSYSGKDQEMRAYLERELASIEGCEFYDDGDNIYAGKGTGQRVCMVAHMDTVHPITDDLTAVVIKGKITGMNAVKMEQTGIGGDDKVGIYIALQMLKEHANIKCFFPRDEEVGCVGSSFVKKEFFDDVTMVLQCDRRGNDDFVTNASGTELSSKAFQDDVLPILTSYGYKFSTGMMTDVMELKEQGINVSMANMSCGYYNPHSDNEYVDIADVHKCTLMVNEIITTLGMTAYPHEAPAKMTWDNWGKGNKLTKRDGSWDWWDDEPIGASAPTRIHATLDDYCQDCWHRPATGAHGLCETCYDYYKGTVTRKPDYSSTPVLPRKRTIAEIEADIAKTRKELAMLNAKYPKAHKLDAEKPKEHAGGKKKKRSKKRKSEYYYGYTGRHTF